MNSRKRKPGDRVTIKSGGRTAGQGKYAGREGVIRGILRREGKDLYILQFPGGDAEGNGDLVFWEEGMFEE